MPHCKVCGNPVSKTDLECRLCGSALKPGHSRGQTGMGSYPGSQSRLEADSYKGNGLSPSGTSPPFNAPEEGTRVWSPRKAFMVILALAILLPTIAFAVVSLTGSNPPFILPSTPNGQFMWVANEDNRTVRATFDDFEPATRFSDCYFRVQMGTWTSLNQEIAPNWHLNVSSSGYPELSMVIYFKDWNINGYVDSGDYCTIYSFDIPIGMQCNIEIFYEPTGGSICSTQFAFL